jgi:hypothetical protein
MKGGGVESRKIALQARAVDAFRELVRLGALVAFVTGPLNVSVKRAARKAGVPLPVGFHAYDLRHTFGTELAVRGIQEGRIGRLMLHAEHSTIARQYTRAANRELDAKVMADLSAWYPPQKAPAAGQAAPQSQPAAVARGKVRAPRQASQRGLKLVEKLGTAANDR